MVLAADRNAEAVTAAEAAAIVPLVVMVETAGVECGGRDQGRD